MTTPSLLATELFNQTMECVAEGKHSVAIELLSQSLNRELRPATYFERAKLYRKTGNLKQSFSDVERAISLCTPFTKYANLLLELVSFRTRILIERNTQRRRDALIKRLATEHDLDGLLTAFDLMPFREAIKSQAEKSLRLRPKEGSNDATRSKFGGNPLMPESEPWPETEDGKPLSFIAQIYLPDLENTCAESLFGGEGLLSFFYEAEKQVWGYDPTHRDQWKVIHFENESNLRERAFPDSLPDDVRFRPRWLLVEEEITFPDFEENDWNMSLEESGRYYEFCSAWFGDYPINRLLGHPQPIQGRDWQLQCQLVSNGITGYEDTRAEELKAAAKEWKLLLQIDTDDDTGIQWGMGGCLYFCTNQQLTGSFDSTKVWMLLQTL